MNPLFFWYQPFLALALIKNFKSKKKKIYFRKQIFLSFEFTMQVSGSQCRKRVNDEPAEFQVSIFN